jgi:methylthioribose-1-phosphate isomerase
MKIGGKQYRAIWPGDDLDCVEVIDQTRLPHELRIVRLGSAEECAAAIRDMVVRGAPLIGAAAAYGIALAVRADPSDASIARASALLLETRPTAINLRWALERMKETLRGLTPAKRADEARELAGRIADEEAAACRAMGNLGAGIVREAWERCGKTRPVRILTHCNAGWLATVDWGTALAPVYVAQEQGIPVHVWVDETRPRNQGMLTAWELGQQGVPHAIVVDNAGGHLMQKGLVDLCIVGTDRTTSRGDVCNKIGTYLKALAAHDNDVPFYVACPTSSIDWTLDDGLASIPIEQRDEAEVTHIGGIGPGGDLVRVRIAPVGSPAHNCGFDVTPGRLVTALITERGVCPASKDGLRHLFGRAS